MKLGAFSNAIPEQAEVLVAQNKEALMKGRISKIALALLTIAMTAACAKESPITLTQLNFANNGGDNYATLKSHVADVSTGFRLFPRRHLPAVLSLASNDLSFSFALTLHALRNDLTIKELPINYREREGRSKLSVSADGKRFLHLLLTTYIRHRYSFLDRHDRQNNIGECKNLRERPLESP